MFDYTHYTRYTRYILIRKKKKKKESKYKQEIQKILKFHIDIDIQYEKQLFGGNKKKKIPNFCTEVEFKIKR